MCDRIPQPSARERALVRRLKYAVSVIEMTRTYFTNPEVKLGDDGKSIMVAALDIALASLSKPFP